MDVLDCYFQQDSGILLNRKSKLFCVLKTVFSMLDEKGLPIGEINQVKFYYCLSLYALIIYFPFQTTF